jgi:O-antigen ligase
MTRGGHAFGMGSSPQWWAIVLLLVLVLALGGSARADVPQLTILRPASALLLGFGLMTLRREHLRSHRPIWLLAAGIVVLPALQLIPLPPGLWQQLPGRGLIVEIDQAAGLGPMWRPLSLTPLATLNALFACLVPLAALVLGIQLGDRNRARLLPAVLVLGGVTALIAIVQIVGGQPERLHLYPITNRESPVGLFANRNHQAVMLALLLPMLAVFGFRERFGLRLLALGGAVLLIPLILATGSRAGLLTALAGLIAVPMITGGSGPSAVRRTGDRWSLDHWRPNAGLLMAGGGAVGIGLMIWFGRDEAWSRMPGAVAGLDQRWYILPTLGRMLADYFPVGTGMGSFERVFQIHEPEAQLGPTYLNHAHNDWMEVVLDGGVLATALLVCALVAFSIALIGAWRGHHGSIEQCQLARLGVAVIALQGFASLFDYPLRTPIHAVVFAIAVLWASPRRRGKIGLKSSEQALRPQ